MPTPELQGGSYFIETFEHAAEIALQHPYTLWYRIKRELFAPSHQQELSRNFADRDITFYELTGVQASGDPEIGEPGGSAYFDRKGISYWQTWSTAEADVVENVTDVVTEADIGQRRKPPDYSSTYTEANIPNLAKVFGPLAANESEFNHVVDRLAEWLRAGDYPESSIYLLLSHAVYNIVAKSLLIPGYAPNHLAVLPQAASDPDLRSKISASMRRGLGKALIGTRCGDLPGKRTQQLDGQVIADFVDAFDEAGMLDDAFWIDFGIKAGGAARNPQFLSTLHAKLSGPDGERMLRERQIMGGGERAQPLVRSYITAILAHYERDPLRHTPNAATLLRSLKSGEGKQSLVDLNRLVNVSNSIARELNRDRGSQRAGEDYLAELRPGDMLSVSDALLRVLYATRINTLPPEMLVDQFDQDVRHAEIVALVIEGARYREARLLGHTALAFPGLSNLQRKRLRELFGANKPLKDALTDR